MTVRKITPFLWFDGKAEEAMNFYVSVFRNSKVIRVSRQGPGPDAPVFSVSFELDGQHFHGLNGGPHYAFTPAVSFFVDCETQAEVDEYWARLSAGGSEERCGWLKDRYGLSWQIIPALLGKLLGDTDRVKAGRAMQAMLAMQKIDSAALQRAFDGA